MTQAEHRSKTWKDVQTVHLLLLFLINVLRAKHFFRFFVGQLTTQHIVEYSKSSADFTIDHHYTIEVGGRSKDGKQIAGIEDGYIAAANEEYVFGNKIPLWLFGMLY